MVSCLNGSGCPCKKNYHPFEWLGLSVRKSFQLFEWLKLPIRAKQNCSPVGTAQAICLKKTVSRSNSLGYPFEKNW